VRSDKKGGPRTVHHIVDVVDEMGVFGTCSCGEQVVYYSDNGVKCRSCGKLYGVWLERKPSPEEKEEIQVSNLDATTHRAPLTF
jgi:uncharacterized protein YbbC (DUF1343 family)